MPTPAVISRAVVGTTATLVVQSANYPRNVLLMQAAGGGVVYVGFTSDVSSGNGFPMSANRGVVERWIPAGKQLWAIGTAAADDIAVWENFGDP